MPSDPPQHPVRRVVTCLGADGRSAVLIDGPVPQSDRISNVIWRTDAIPADNATTVDPAGVADVATLRSAGSNFMLIEFPEGAASGMHATNTIDYITIIRGNLTIVLESGDVVLRAGDTLVDRGILHGWRNDGPGTTQAAVVTIPAHQVAGGWAFTDKES